jgi:vanillate O-demethylase monooxygenase subunit
LHGDAIACPYHGLQFSPDGHCSHNPHGPAPKSVKVRAYPLTELYGMVWIWMGDPNGADPAKLPELAVREDDRFDWAKGYLHVDGNYQLVTDNLLDLTHVEFMHPFLAGTDLVGETKVTCLERGDQVVSRYWQQDSARTPLVAALWDEAPQRTSMIVEMRWTAPANLSQDNGFDAVRPEPGDSALLVPFCHLLTPETETTTHYFWAGGRNMKCGDPAVSAGFEQAIAATFRGEDEPMIADIQRRIGKRDLLDLKPLLLSIDKSAVLARRRIAALIAAEA